jgi:hypothetical protein
MRACKGKMLENAFASTYGTSSRLAVSWTSVALKLSYISSKNTLGGFGCYGRRQDQKEVRKPRRIWSVTTNWQRERLLSLGIPGSWKNRELVHKTLGSCTVPLHGTRRRSDYIRNSIVLPIETILSSRWSLT